MTYTRLRDMKRLAGSLRQLSFLFPTEKQIQSLVKICQFYTHLELFGSTLDFIQIQPSNPIIAKLQQYQHTQVRPRHLKVRIVVQGGKECFIRNLRVFHPVEKFSCCSIVDDVLHKTSYSDNMHRTFRDDDTIRCCRLSLKTLRIASRYCYTIIVTAVISATTVCRKSHENFTKNEL